MKNNFEKIIKFKFLFFVSLFLALMLLNTDKVFAAKSLTGGGFTAEQKPGSSGLVSLYYNDVNISSEKTILKIDYDYFDVGFTDELAILYLKWNGSDKISDVKNYSIGASSSDTSSSGSTSLDFIEFCKNEGYNGTIIVHSYAIQLEETTEAKGGKKYLATGWYYLASYKAYWEEIRDFRTGQIMHAYTDYVQQLQTPDLLLPRVYPMNAIDDTEYGYINSIPCGAEYYPISSSKCNPEFLSDGDNGVYYMSQISDFTQYLADRNAGMYEPHNIADFGGLSGKYRMLWNTNDAESLEDGFFLQPNEAWLLYYVTGTLCHPVFTGVSYENAHKVYVFGNSNDGIVAEINSTLSKDNFFKELGVLRGATFTNASQIFNDVAFRQYKDATQIIGVDSVYLDEAKGNQKEQRPFNTSNALLDVNNVFRTVAAGKEFSFFRSKEGCVIFGNDEAVSTWDSAVNSNLLDYCEGYTKFAGKDCVIRNVWGAEMGFACQIQDSFGFGRDVDPDGKWDWTHYSISDNPNFKYESGKISHFANAGTAAWEQYSGGKALNSANFPVPTIEQLYVSVIALLDMNPALCVKLWNMVKGRADYQGKYVGAINALMVPEFDYFAQDWKNTIIDGFSYDPDLYWEIMIGQNRDGKKMKNGQKSIINIFYDSFLLSNLPAYGMPTAAYCCNTDITYYCGFESGKAIVPKIEPAGIKNDIVVSNSYNQNVTNSDESLDFKFKLTQRNVIDWIDNPSLNIDGLNIQSCLGGTTDTKVNNVSSNYIYNTGRMTQFDVATKLFFNGGQTGYGLEKNKNNVVDITKDANLGQNAEDNESIMYKNYVFVGRTPESGQKTASLQDKIDAGWNTNIPQNPDNPWPEEDDNKLTLKDFDVVALAKFNSDLDGDEQNIVESFRPEYDGNMFPRYMAGSSQSSAANGTAKEILNQAFGCFETDYNKQTLFNRFQSFERFFGITWRGKASGQRMQVIATPRAILKCNPTTAKKPAYQIEEYNEKGPQASGYSGISSLGGWTVSSQLDKNTSFDPGDVVCYEVLYTVPSDETIKATTNTLEAYTDTEFHNEYFYTTAFLDSVGTIITIDLDYELMPHETALKKNGNGEEAKTKWERLNENTNNDWVRERLTAPILHNVCFSSCTVSIGGKSETGTGSAKNSMFGIPYHISPQGGSIWEVEFNFENTTTGTTKYNNSPLKIDVQWYYYYKTLPISNTSYYDRINYKNPYRDNKTMDMLGTSSGGGGHQKNYRSQNIPDGNNLTLNNMVLNRDNTAGIELSIKRNAANQLHMDWELIRIIIKGPPKDNEVTDLILSNGSADLGDPSVYRGGKESDEQIVPESKMNQANCVYAVVKRNDPSFSWEEGMLKGSYGNLAEAFQNPGGTLYMKCFINDSSAALEYYLSPLTVSIGRYTGKSVQNFKLPGDYMVYRASIYSDNGNLKAVEAYASYGEGKPCQDDEDVNKSNNNWTERWVTTTNVDYVIRFVDGPADVDIPGMMRGYRNGTSFETIRNLENFSAWQNFTIAQQNEQWQGGAPAYIHLKFQKLSNQDLNSAYSNHNMYANVGTIQTISGISYMGNGLGTYAFGAGDTSEKHCTARWNPTSFTEGLYRFTGHINGGFDRCGSCYRDNKEINFKDNEYIDDWMVKVTYSGTPGWIEPLRPKVNCTNNTSYVDNDFIGCKHDSPYTWNVKFEWSQTNCDKMLAKGHWLDCNGGSPYGHISLGEDPCHPVYDGADPPNFLYNAGCSGCHCWCDFQIAMTSENHGKVYWRTELGFPLYYENHWLSIMCWSSAHGTRNIFRGATTVYTGEEFRYWFEYDWHSDRDSLPPAKHHWYYGGSAYHDDKNGTKCDHNCNNIYRWPYTNSIYFHGVLIEITGDERVGGHYLNWFSVDAYGSNGGGSQNKKLYWLPKESFRVQDTTVDKTIQLFFCSEYNRGNYPDTWNSVRNSGYSAPGYAMYDAGRGKYIHWCDKNYAYIYIRPSKSLIGSYTQDITSYGDEGTWINEGNRLY